MAQGTYLKKVRICLMGSFKHNHSDVKRWVEAAGGVYQSGVDKDTTHIVASEEHWRKKIASTLAKKKGKYNQDIHIVHYDWLEDSMFATSKKSEGKYLWEKLDEKHQKKLRLKLKEKERAQKEEEKQRKKAEKEEEKKEKARTKISYATALTEHTDSFMSAEEKAALLRKSKAYRSSSPTTAGSEAARNFRKGARAAQKDIFSDNHHVYTDETGFRCDVSLYKIDMLKNINERQYITMYESNSEPPTYATHVRITGTKRKEENSTPAALGANFLTAFRLFRKVFFESTGVQWDDRIQAFEKTKDRRSDSSTSSVAALQQNRAKKAAGVKPETAKAKGTREKQDWDNLRFTYKLPPANMPRGKLPNDAHVHTDPRVPVQSIEKSPEKNGVDNKRRKKIIVVDDDDEEEDVDTDDDSDMGGYLQKKPSSMVGEVVMNKHVMNNDTNGSQGAQTQQAATNKQWNWGNCEKSATGDDLKKNILENNNLDTTSDAKLGISDSALSSNGGFGYTTSGTENGPSAGPVGFEGSSQVHADQVINNVAIDGEKMAV